MNKQEIELLRQEVEMLMVERTRLLKLVGAAAVLVSKSEVRALPEGAVNAAEALAEMLNTLPEETLKEALDSVRSDLG